jgi:hypothetical protein
METNPYHRTIKGTQAWDSFWFFVLNQNLIWSWSIFQRKFNSFLSIFARILVFEHIRYLKLFEIFALLRQRHSVEILTDMNIQTHVRQCENDFVACRAYAEAIHRLMSISGNDFICDWVNAETILILSLTESMKKFPRNNFAGLCIQPASLS